MLDTVLAYSVRHQLLPERGRVIVAVSGGADSLCLLHLLIRLCGPAKRYPETSLHVAHLNHMLRGETSEEEARAIKRLAESWGLPVTIGALDVPALARQEQRSLEEAARVARYRFLRAVAQGDLIAVAHHMDDQVETLLLHWLRGGGLASTAGLQPRQGDIIRPLLDVKHADTLAYCEQHQLPVLEDASNNDPRFLRNRIRHELIPLLSALNPGIRETLLRNAEVMEVDFAWIETQVDMYWSEVVSEERDELIQLRLNRLQVLPLSIQRHLLRRVTARLSAGQSPLELRHYRLIEGLIERTAGSQTLTLHLPQHIYVTRQGSTLLFARVPVLEDQPAQEHDTTEVTLPIPGHVKVVGTPWTASAQIVPEEIQQQARAALRRGDWATVWHILPVTQYTVFIDRDRLAGEHENAAGNVLLHVRTWRAGDRMQPLGMTHEKKIQDVLVDRHIPRAERTRLPLFFSATRCVWLAGVQLDDRVRLTGETRQIVCLSISKS